MTSRTTSLLSHSLLVGAAIVTARFLEPAVSTETHGWILVGVCGLFALSGALLWPVFGRMNEVKAAPTAAHDVHQAGIRIHLRKRKLLSRFVFCAVVQAIGATCGLLLTKSLGEKLYLVSVGYSCVVLGVPTLIRLIAEYLEVDRFRLRLDLEEKIGVKKRETLEKFKSSDGAKQTT